MKPLTIEQLKALEVGDWVWLIDKIGDTKSYWSISENTNEYLLVYQECYSFGNLNYSDYGKTWLAYKHKEAAEAKGEIVELPCIREVEAVECGAKTTRFQVCFIRKDMPCRNAIDYYTTDIKSEAERRLAELTGN